MVKKTENYISSSIVIKGAVLSDFKKDHISTEKVKISFRRGEYNELEIVFDFDNTSYSQSEAYVFAHESTLQIGHWFVLNKNSCVEIKSCHTVAVNNHGSSERGMYLEGAMRVSFPSKTYEFFNPNFRKLKHPLKFFNFALCCKNEGGNKEEIAFNLYYSYESLAFELYGEKNRLHKLEQEVVKENVCSRDEFKSFIYSVGKYYRHPLTKDKGDLMNIDECIDVYKNILKYFIEKN